MAIARSLNDEQCKINDEQVRALMKRRGIADPTEALEYALSVGLGRLEVLDRYASAKKSAKKGGK